MQWFGMVPELSAAVQAWCCSRQVGRSLPVEASSLEHLNISTLSRNDSLLTAYLRILASVFRFW